MRTLLRIGWAVGKPVLLSIAAVIAVLALFGDVHFVWSVDKLGEAKAANADLDLKNLGTAVRRYQQRTGHLPSTDAGFRALIHEGLDKVPIDPWGHEYSYAVVCDEVKLTSWGKDGAPGCEGFAADITVSFPVATPVSTTQSRLRNDP